jgi:AP-3 complex subunit beta
MASAALQQGLQGVGVNVSNMGGMGGESHFFEESMNPMKVQEYLSRSKEQDKLKGMKWLLAMMSKGKDVSDFFSDVVKNVVVRSVEVKKMVYIYLVHYADASPTCRELALLSINSFQKDLAASNQLIRALALRVMTSIRVPDIIQIQLLAVRKCASDSSPYVRKCAANAVPKIYMLDPDRGMELAQLLEKLLSDGSTMVLGSAVAAYNEVCPAQYELLHPAFRKLCHLLADVDEWGQILMLSVLSRYARVQFLDPDRGGASSSSAANDGLPLLQHRQAPSSSRSSRAAAAPASKSTRRVVKKAFYSDEEDESTEEELDLGISQPEVGSVFTSADADVLSRLDPDHRLLLRMSLPLLKSRNTGVVLAVCTLHYHCGVLEGGVGAQLAKAMIRILRSRREIQYAVLRSIIPIVTSRPSMFRPFLCEFFVKAVDPPYVSLAKLEIMTRLISSDNCDTVLREFQGYVRAADKTFVCAAARAVGRVADAQPQAAPRCLQGLLALIMSSKTKEVVGEAVIVVRHLLQQDEQPEVDRGPIIRTLVRKLLQSMFPDVAQPNQTAAQACTPISQPQAQASVIWMAAEHANSPCLKAVAPDLLRLLASAFITSDVLVRMQILNLATKMTLLRPEDASVDSVASYVLELASFDPNHNVRDQARFMIAMLGMASSDGADVDTAALVALRAKAPSIMLRSKLPPLSVSTDAAVVGGSSGSHFFDVASMSSLVGYRMPCYVDLPPWSTTEPNPTIRDPPAATLQQPEQAADGEREFYENEDASSTSSYSSSSSSGSSSSSSSSGETESDSDVSSGSESESIGSDGGGDATSTGESSSGSSGEVSSQLSESEKESDGEGIGLLPNAEKERLTSYGASHISNSNVSSLIGELSLEGMSTPPRRAELGRIGSASSETPPASIADEAIYASYAVVLMNPDHAGGMAVNAAFARGPGAAVAQGTQQELLITLTNCRDDRVPIRRIKAMPPRDGTLLIGWKEVQQLAPAETVQVNLRVDLGGRSKEVRFELRTDKGSFMATLTPPQVELLRPQSIAEDAFVSHVQRLSGSATSCDFVLPEGRAVNTREICTRILKTAHLTELNFGGLQHALLRFAGVSLAGSQTDKVFVILESDGPAAAADWASGKITVCSDNPLLPPLLLGDLKRGIELASR